MNDYLQQLLGLSSESDKLKSFVEDLGRYRRGEKLVHNGDGDDDDFKEAEDSNTKPPARRQPESQKSLSVSNSQNNINNKSNKSNNQKQQKSRVPPPARRKSPPRAAIPSPSTESASVKSAVQSSATTKMASSGNDSTAISPFSSQPTTTSTTKTVTKSRPTKGQRKVPVCGCFGTKHEPLTNCLLCGRISCVIETYDYCPFCSYMLEEIKVDERYVEHTCGGCFQVYAVIRYIASYEYFFFSVFLFFLPCPFIGS